MRNIFTTAQAFARGISPAELRWGERTGRWRRLTHGVYVFGSGDPTPFDVQCAEVLRSGTCARGYLAGVLHGLDGVALGGRPVRRGKLTFDEITVVDDIPCADGLHTLIDLAGLLDDRTWEFALESALRKGLVDIAAIEATLPALSAGRVTGVGRIRRVLASRPTGAPPTGSILETAMVQLVRDIPDVPEPQRQVEVFDEDGYFVARVDLASPDPGMFTELDGQGHVGQPLYDARRETAVVAVTGWLPSRFTFKEVFHLPENTKRRYAAIADQARRRHRQSRRPA